MNGKRDILSYRRGRGHAPSWRFSSLAVTLLLVVLPRTTLGQASAVLMPRLPGLGPSVVAVTPDDRFVLSGGGIVDHALTLHDAVNGRTIRRFTGHRDVATDLDLDPATMEAVSSSEDGTVRLWDLRTGAARILVQGRAPGVDVCSPNFRGRPSTDPVTAVAFAATGRHVIVGLMDGMRLVDRNTGAEIRRIDRIGAIGRSGTPVSAIEVAPRGGRVFTTAPSRSEIDVWDPSTGRRVEQIEAHDAPVTALRVSRAPPLVVVSGASDGSVRLWDVDTLSEVDAYSISGSVSSVAVSPTGRYVAAAGEDGRLWIWDRDAPAGTPTLVSGSALALGDVRDLFWGTSRLGVADVGVRLIGIGSPPPPAPGILLSPFALPYSVELRDVRAFIGLAGAVFEWNLESGATRLHATGESNLSGWAADPTGRALVVGDGNGQVSLHDTELGTRVRTYEAGTGPTRVSVDPNGSRLITATSTWLSHWDLIRDPDGRPADLRRRATTAIDRGVAAVDVRGSWATTAELDALRIWALESGGLEEVGRVRRSNAEDFYLADAVRISPNGQYVFGGSFLGDTRVWRLRDRREGLTPLCHSTGPVSALGFDLSGNQILIGGWDGGLRRVRLEDQTLDRAFLGHSGEVSSISRQQGSIFATTSLDGTIRLWTQDDAQPLATLLVSEEDASRWVAVDRVGRFDTGSIEGSEGLSWVASDAPLSPVPLEVFMRTHYEPGLVSKLLAGAELRAVPDVTDLNRTLPIVSVVDVRPSVDRPSEIDVTVAVEPVVNSEGRSSGAFDLRLFRDGHLVARWPDVEDTEIDPDLERWRTRHALLSGQDGTVTRTATVRLPRGTATDSVVLSAYAFNEDRVKSLTVRRTHGFARALPGPRRAYVIAVGVGYSDDSDQRLTFAAHDAATVLDSLVATLERSGAYDEVIGVPLLQDADPRGLRVFELPEPSARPTKANIRQVIEILGGRASDTGTLPLPIAERLRPAEPQDAVIVYVASHGLRDPHGGEFVLLPTDIGSGTGLELEPSQLARGISSTELGAWLGPVDAGSIALVLSTCYAESAVAAEGFRPGPMGDVGFGQLAYDKGLSVLAAAQSAARARRLTHVGRALAEEGLRSLRGRGGSTLQDLLRYAVEHVPELSAADDDPQVPRLFDWKRSSMDVTLYP